MTPELTLEQEGATLLTSIPPELSCRVFNLFTVEIAQKVTQVIVGLPPVPSFTREQLADEFLRSAGLDPSQGLEEAIRWHSDTCAKWLAVHYFGEGMPAATTFPSPPALCREQEACLVLMSVRPEICAWFFQHLTLPLADRLSRSIITMSTICPALRNTIVLEFVERLGRGEATLVDPDGAIWAHRERALEVLCRHYLGVEPPPISEAAPSLDKAKITPVETWHGAVTLMATLAVLTLLFL